MTAKLLYTLLFASLVASCETNYDVEHVNTTEEQKTRPFTFDEHTHERVDSFYVVSADYKDGSGVLAFLDVATALLRPNESRVVFTRKGRIVSEAVFDEASTPALAGFECKKRYSIFTPLHFVNEGKHGTIKPTGKAPTQQQHTFTMASYYNAPFDTVIIVPPYCDIDLIAPRLNVYTQHEIRTTANSRDDVTTLVFLHRGNTLSACW